MPDQPPPVERATPFQPTGAQARDASGPLPGPAVQALDAQPSELSARIEGFVYRLEALRDHAHVGASLTAVCLAAVVALWWIGRPADPPPVELTIPMAAETESPATSVTTTGDLESGGGSAPGVETRAEDTIPEHAVVHVSGAVARQGLVTVAVDGRIADAVEAAGGPVDDADLHQLNLAALVQDGQHIRVPRINERLDGPLVEPPSSPDPGATAGGPIGSTVNINTADLVGLQQLPGVGPATADAIVQWRTDNGLFESVDDLVLVSGIGPAKLEALRDRATT